MSLREITGTITVGQQQPLIPVPDPEDATAHQLLANRLFAHVLRELRKPVRPGASEADAVQSVRLLDLMVSETCVREYV